MFRLSLVKPHGIVVGGKSAEQSTTGVRKTYSPETPAENNKRRFSSFVFIFLHHSEYRAQKLLDKYVKYIHIYIYIYVKDICIYIYINYM